MDRGDRECVVLSSWDKPRKSFHGLLGERMTVMIESNVGGKIRNNRRDRVRGGAD